jgi:hypothetical protein
MQILRSITLFGLLLAIFLFRLDTIPSLSWDEGWTLSVARNWVERGHYGRLLEGNLAPGGLEAAVTVVMPIVNSNRVNSSLAMYAISDYITGRKNHRPL